MRRIIMSAALAAFAIFTATAASAQTATQDINISATVPKACTVGNVASGTPDSATINVSAAGSVTTSSVVPSGSPFQNVACNAPSILQVSSLSGGAKNAGSAGGGFTNTIHYTATASWNGAQATVDTSSSATGTPVNVGTANSGPLGVSITPLANTLPLLQGGYSDTLRVTLTPQP